MMLLVLVLGTHLACAPKAPPIFWAEIPPEHVPPVPDINQRDNECAVSDLFVGEAIDPMVAISGKIQCDGHVISVAKALDLTYQEDLAGYYERRYEVCHIYRQADRSTCETAYQAQWSDATAARRRGAALEVAVGLAFVAGVALGAIAVQAPTYIAPE